MKLRKSKMYKTIFIIYTIILFLSVSILEVYFYNYSFKNIVQNNLDTNNKAVNQIVNYINEIQESSNLILNLLYESSQELEDTVNFLKEDTQTYLTNKLNRFQYNGTKDLDMTGFIKKGFKINSHIIDISLISYEKDTVITFNKDGSISTQLMTFRPQGYKLVEVSTSEDIITFMKKVRDVTTQKELGILAISYQMNDLNNYIKIYEQTIQNHNFILIDQRGKVIYDTKSIYSYANYPHLENNSLNQEKIQTDTKSYISITYHNTGISVIGQIPRETIKLNFESILTIFLIGITVFISGEILVYIKLKDLSKRTNQILEAMGKVKQGDLNIHIEDMKEDDEINTLAHDFNDMCKELNTYIQKSYLAELEQQKVEMDMLQAQINPHFLYNTLEVIRMKAICNNDKEVGKMLYALAVIFRSQVKERNIISLGKELHYCKKYIELFQLRYEDCFNYEFNYQEEILENTVLKFIIQPVIENYFVHGIRLESTDNYIKITVKDGQDILIIIEDNGKGIEHNKLLEIQHNLDAGIYNGNSLGIYNVQKRLTMYYGKEYKLKIESSINEGTKAYIKIPNSRVGTDNV